VRNRTLHDALRDFALEAAALLTDDVGAGAELSFDVVEARGRGGVLYEYRALTSDFIGERWPRLRALPAFPAAARALGSGAAAYLRVRGAPGADAEPALRAMLERLYEDAAGFDFPEERFERVYGEVERVLYEHALRVTVVAPLRGLVTESERVELGAGLALVRGDRIEAPPEAVWHDGDQPATLCAIEDDVDSDAPLPLDDASERFLALQTALRLFKAGGFALGPLGWARADNGAWRQFAVGSLTPPRGEPLWLPAAEEDELRAFLEALGQARLAGPVAWGLTRFELGCGQPRDVDALSDYLLALGALLRADDDSGRAGLSLRTAALCAGDGARRAVQRRLELAFALEQFVVRGGGAYHEAIGAEPPSVLVGEVEGHVRALLRDVMCGYLDPDLRATADEMLLASEEPVEIQARDLRAEREAAVPAIVARERVPGGIATELDARATPEEGELEPVTSELDAVEPSEPPPTDGDADPGVTHSADWDSFDDDPASYSAPV
jgi:hypothetical protein